MTSSSTTACWCGSNEFEPAPHEAYSVCRGCGSAWLIELLEHGADAMRGQLAEFYGERYWTEHQTAHSMPPIEERARQDLGERCAYWLGHLLRYRTAPASVLEVGCGHGGFLKVMELCGYAASGTEVNADAARFGKQQFGVEIKAGFVEELAQTLGAYDCIVLLDVLEHFADPDAVVGLLAPHLKPDGIIMIQTPCHRPDLPPDWPMYFPPEHTVLLSRDSVCSLLERHGFGHVEFEPALFDYDMFLFASKAALSPVPAASVASRLEQSPDGRMALALIETGASLTQSQQQVVAMHQSARAQDAAITQLTHQMGSLPRSPWVRLGRLLRLIRTEPRSTP